MKADELRHIARKLRTYVGIYPGDKEARSMAKRCSEVADFLDAANKWRDALYEDSKTPDQKAINDAAEQHRREVVAVVPTESQKP